MRFKLTLAVNPNTNILPLNYQYPFSSWIYQRIAEADRNFSTWLHNQGYLTNTKRFKLFTFSNFYIPRRKVTGDRLNILSDHVTIQVSFFIDKIAEHFIIGLFQGQEVVIGDKISKAHFIVRQVESLPIPKFDGEAEFTCLSPICVARPITRQKKIIGEYLSPEHPDYQFYLIKNLIEKYKAIKKSNAKNFHEMDFQFTLLNRPKSRLVIIKSGRPDEIKIRGYFYRFRLKAPSKLLTLGYLAGFGEKNSLGFGCVDVMKSEVKK